MGRTSGSGRVSVRHFSGNGSRRMQSWFVPVDSAHSCRADRRPGHRSMLILPICFDTPRQTAMDAMHHSMHQLRQKQWKLTESEGMHRIPLLDGRQVVITTCELPTSEFGTKRSQVQFLPAHEPTSAARISGRILQLCLRRWLGTPERLEGEFAPSTATRRPPTMTALQNARRRLLSQPVSRRAMLPRAERLAFGTSVHRP